MSMAMAMVVSGYYWLVWVCDFQRMFIKLKIGSFQLFMAMATIVPMTMPMDINRVGHGLVFRMMSIEFKCPWQWQW